MSEQHEPRRPAPHPTPDTTSSADITPAVPRHGLVPPTAREDVAPAAAQQDLARAAAQQELAPAEQFQFNPYIPFLRIGQGYAWKVSLSQDVLLPAAAHSLVEVIRQGGSLPIEQLRQHFTLTELVNLFTQRILIDPIAGVPDQYSRTHGFWSVAGSAPHGTRVHQASVLVLGAGAIGSHVAWMLAAIGIRRMVVVDFDQVEVSNLNRQILYTLDDVGHTKVNALADHLTLVNPAVEVVPVAQRITSARDIRDLIERYGCQAVVKAIDTPQEVITWINQACVETHVAYVQGGFIGAAALIGPHYVPRATPCWDCYQPAGHGEVRHLSGGGGTIAHLTEITAGKMVRDLVGILNGEPIREPGTMEIYDERTNTSQRPAQARKTSCDTCHARHRGRAPRTKAPLPVEAGYLLLCALLPLFSGLPGWGPGTVLASLLFVQCLLTAEPDSQRLFRLSFLGGSLYAIVLTALTVRNRPSLVGIPTTGLDALAVLHIGLLVAVLMALLITVFQWSAMALHSAQQALARRRTPTGPRRAQPPRRPTLRILHT